ITGSTPLICPGGSVKNRCPAAVLVANRCTGSSCGRFPSYTSKTVVRFRPQGGRYASYWPLGPVPCSRFASRQVHSMQLAQFDLHAQIERRHWWFVARRRIIRSLIEAAIPPDQDRLVIDVGCGTGGN